MNNPHDNSTSFSNYVEMFQKMLQRLDGHKISQPELLHCLGMGYATSKNSSRYKSVNDSCWGETVKVSIQFMQDPIAGLSLFHSVCKKGNFSFLSDNTTTRELKKYTDWKKALTSQEYAIFKDAIDGFEQIGDITSKPKIVTKQKNVTLCRFDYLVLIFPLSVIITCSQSLSDINTEYSSHQIKEAFIEYYKLVFGKVPNIDFLSPSRSTSGLSEFNESISNLKGLVPFSPDPSLFSDNTRNIEINQINEILTSSNLVIIYGEAGMGKSELAKIYAKVTGKKYKAIQFISAESGVKKAIISLRFKDILTKEIKTDDDAKDIFMRNMKLLSELDDTNLIIFDNLDYPAPQDLQSLIELTGINAKIIVTSRRNFQGHDRLKSLMLNPLQDNVAIQLFYSYYTNGVLSQAQDRTDLINLLKEVGFNTLFIKLIASTLQNNFITIKELQTAFEAFDYNSDIWVNVEHSAERDGIETVSQDMLGHLKVIFNISVINKNPYSISIMQAMALIPFSGINQKNLYDIFFADEMKRGTYINTIQELSQNGWLEIDNHILRLHPAISYLMIADESLRPEPLQFGNENNTAFRLYNYIYPFIQQINCFQFFNGNTDEINEQTTSALQIINTALFMIPRIMCYKDEFFCFLCQVSTSCRLFDLLVENQRILNYISQIAENDAFELNDDLAMKATISYFDVAMFYTFTDEYQIGEEFLRYENLPSYVRRGIKTSPLLHAKWIDNLKWCIFNQSKDYEHCMESVIAYADEIIQLENFSSDNNEVKKEIAALYYNIGTVLSNPVMKLKDDNERISIFTALDQLFHNEVNPDIIYSKYECYDVAERYVQKSIEILRNIYKTENADIECTREMNQIAFIWKCRARISDDPTIKQAHIKKAIQIYATVLELRLEKFGKMSHYIVTQYRNLGDAYRELYQTTCLSSDYDFAIQYFDQALNLQEKLYGKDARFLNWLSIKNDFTTKKR